MSEDIDFGDLVQIEMKRYISRNEFYTHKVINRLESNTWVDVPVQSPAKEVMHTTTEPVISAVCGGVVEDQVLKYRLCDVKLVKKSLRVILKSEEDLLLAKVLNII